MMNKLLYSPTTDIIKQTQIYDFMSFFGDICGEALNNYNDLHKASITHKAKFWKAIIDYFNIIGDFKGPIFTKGAHIKQDKFFPDSHLNYAENLLSHFSDPEAIMMIYNSEGHEEISLSVKDAKSKIVNLQNFLSEAGIKSGDRVGAVMPNMPQTVISMLSVTSLGGVWASCSPDFGVESIIDRFSQIKPKIVIIADQYRYNGKMIDLSDKISHLQEKLPEVEKFIVISFIPKKMSANIKDTHKLAYYEDITKTHNSSPIHFTRVRFSDPLFILFSSGTTGAPKCIVHSVGGTLLQHIKEHRLHCNIRPKDRFFYYTTCGWMMWNWLVSGLAAGATLLLYDGSPFAPSHNILFDYLSKHKATFFGTSAKYIDSLKKMDFSPKDSYNLTDLRMIASTGSALSPEGFEYVYDHIKSDIHLSSISGGTDIISCFVLGAPNLAVYSGQIQAKGLGMDVDIIDENMHSLTAEKGELICRSSFVSMPIGFWNDPDGEKYHKAYFDSFDNIWAHGDFAQATPEQGIIIHGRSDTILNPGGVRIGTAEIYRQVEKCNEVLEAVCIGQDYEDDIRVLLFVTLKNGFELTEDLIKKIKKTIRDGTSPRHVPSIIKSVPDIPRTKSGKVTEIAVRDIIHNKQVMNMGALANPQSLEYFKKII